MNRKKAFSLMELSVSIVIISILIMAAIKGVRILTSAQLSAARSMTANSPVANIPNLILWLETTSKDSFKLSNYGDGTSLNSQTWYDINPQELIKNNATGGASTGPTYATNGINNLPAVKFDGATQYMTIANSEIIASTDYTVFVVEKPTATSPVFNMFLGPDISVSCVIANTYQCFHFGYLSSTSIRLAYWGTALDTSNTQLSMLSPYKKNIGKIHTGLFNMGRTNGVRYYFNGNFGNAMTVNNPITLNTSMTIGAVHGLGMYGGYIGEIIIFRRALNDRERWSVEAYLAKKWGVTVAQTS